MVRKRFPEHFKCTRQTGGSLDPDTKAYSGGTPETIYDGSCSAQELSKSEQAKIMSLEGDRTIVASYKLFFPVDLMSTLKVEDTGILTFEDGFQIRLKILEYRRLDSSFLSKYIGDVQ